MGCNDRAPEERGKGKEKKPKSPSWVAAETPVDSIFRDSHKSMAGEGRSQEQLGADQGKVWREREAGEPKGWFSCVGLILFPVLA